MLFYVVTPSAERVEPVTDEGQGPLVNEPDLIEVEADTARDVIAAGVQLMLNTHGYHYCRNQRSDGGSPYVGVKAYPADV